MTDLALDDEQDVFSIFMKKSGIRKGNPNWLLVTCFRNGVEQIAQAAWRVFPSDVDLAAAQSPTDVLAAFAEKFGTDIRVGNRIGKFIDATKLSKSPLEDEMRFQIEATVSPQTELFYSWSNRKTKDPSIFVVGLAYCIDIKRYRASLIAQGSSVR